ncbi:MAG: SDR family oxidoreductase, partial [Deltaproteobacteria bacterium]|nr:SDR family oxidoreductase [Deltaproteobacteria bacterium]
SASSAAERWDSTLSSRSIKTAIDPPPFLLAPPPSATRSIKGQFPYAVSKGGLTRMTQLLALEAPRYGVRVNALAPGYILTDVSRVLLESERSPTFMQGIPLRRYGEFEDLDGPLLLLASDASRYMNGSVVVVDGGHICASL